MELLYDPTIQLLGIYIYEKKMKSKDTYTPMFMTVLFTVAKIWKQPKMSTNR